MAKELNTEEPAIVSVIISPSVKKVTYKPTSNSGEKVAIDNSMAPATA